MPSIVQFDRPTQQGTLLRRYKRFLADVELEDGQTITVHCPNSGSMKACCEPGSPVLLSDSQNPKRKLRHTWELIRMGRSWVSVHSARSNELVAKWIDDGQITEFSQYTDCRREVAYGDNKRSRVDLMLSGPDTCYVEIKHSTMRVGKHAAFPDAVTTRGRKHLEDLTTMVRQGNRAVMFYVVGRSDCERFRPADEIDPEYGKALREAVAQGVELLAYRVKFSPKGANLLGPVPIDI